MKAIKGMNSKKPGEIVWVMIRDDHDHLLAFSSGQKARLDDHEIPGKHIYSVMLDIMMVQA